MAGLKYLFPVVAFLVLAMTTASLAEDTVEVTAFGVGMTAQDAEKNALINAVQQAVGALIDSETLIKNEEVIYEHLYSASSGFVKKYDVKVPPRKRPTDGLYETTIKAIVQKDRVGEQLAKSNVTVVKVDAKDIWAQAITTIQGQQQALELLEKYLPEAPLKILRARLITKDGKTGPEAAIPEVKADRDTGEAICTWNVEVSFDRNAYYEYVAPRLTLILDKLVDQKLDPRTLRFQRTWGRSTMNAHLGLTTTAIRFVRDGDFVPGDNTMGSGYVLLLNVSSYGNGYQERFQPYVFSSQEEFNDLIGKRVQPVALQVTLRKGDGNVISKNVIALDKTLAIMEDPSQRDGHGSVYVGKEEEARASGWLVDRSGHHPGSHLLSPEFEVIVSAKGGGFSDSIVMKVSMSLNPDDIKKIKQIELSFNHTEKRTSNRTGRRPRPVDIRPR